MKLIESFINVNKWIKLLLGSSVCLAIFLIVYFLDIHESLFVKQTIIYLAVPGAYALIGLMEIISGLPFMEISDKWDSIAGWQRGILGITIVSIFFLVIAFSVVAFTTK